MKKNLLLIILFFVSFIHASAQKLSLQNVAEIRLRNAGAIKQSGEVKGYYFFYQTDKINKKTNEYTLQVTDENLKTIKEVKLQDKEDVIVHASSFNGSDLLVLFHNVYDSKVRYKIFGADGNLKWEYENEIKEPQMISSMPEDLKRTLVREAIGEIYPVEGKGFVSKRAYKGGKSFEINYYSSENKKSWTYLATEGKFIGGTYLGTTGNTILLAEFKLSGMFDRNPEAALVALDMETGKELYRKPVEQPTYKFMPAVMYKADKSLPLVFGEYYDAKQSMVKDKSVGIAFWEVDDKGTIVRQKQISWIDIFSKKFSITDKGKIEGFGYLFVHDMIRLVDGNIFVVGEGYSTSGGKTYTTDMMVLKFDKKLELQDMQLFPKQANPVNLDGGGAFMSNQTKGYVMKFEDKFDYAYMQKNSSNDAFSVCYADYVKTTAYKGGTFNSISYYEGKFTTDKIKTKSDATITAMLPASQGKVLLVDYYQKEKRLDLHFEKLN